MIAWLLACVAPGDDSTSPRHHDSAADTGDSIPTVETAETADTSPGESAETGEPADTSHADEPLPLCINEFMPANASSVYDNAGAASDWVELHNPGDVDVDLEGWALTDDEANPNKSKLPATVIPAGGYALYWATGVDEEVDDQLAFKLSGDGGQVGLFAPDGRGSVVNYGLVNPDYSVSRVTNCCTGDDCFEFDFRGTPGVSNTPVLYDETDIVGVGSTWRYWADSAVDDDWYTTSYADSPWTDGQGPLGYGGTQYTTIPYGDDPNHKWPTAWFRHYFVASDLDTYDVITLYLLRDDGAAVYLNGVELLRDNLPMGTLTPATLALASEETSGTYLAFELEPGALLDGPNELAVEVHQVSVSSADLVFDLAIIGGVVIAE